MFDTTIHLGDLISPIVFGAGAWILKRAVRPVTQFVEQMQGYDRRIEATAEVVDLHTDVLLKSGWTRGVELRPVSRRRRKHDVEFSG